MLQAWCPGTTKFWSKAMHTSIFSSWHALVHLFTTGSHLLGFILGWQSHKEAVVSELNLSPGPAADPLG